VISNGLGKLAQMAVAKPQIAKGDTHALPIAKLPGNQEMLLMDVNCFCCFSHGKVSAPDVAERSALAGTVSYFTARLDCVAEQIDQFLGRDP
jgi:hypothetical protein